MQRVEELKTKDEISLQSDQSDQSDDSDSPFDDRSAGQGYYQNLPSERIGLGEAIAVFRMLRWEYLHPTQPHVIKPKSAVSLFASRMGMFTSSVISKLPHVMHSSTTKASQAKSLILMACASMYGDVKESSWTVNQIGRDMLERYCKYDDPEHPSVLFDGIFVGTMLLSLAMIDQDKKLKNKGHVSDYPPLGCLLAACNIDKSFNAKHLDSEYRWMESDECTDKADGTTRELILRIGYKALMEQSIPFDGVIPTSEFEYSSKWFPVHRFERYGLKPNAYLNAAEYTHREQYDPARSKDLFSLASLLRGARSGQDERSIFGYALQSKDLAPCSSSPRP